MKNLFKTLTITLLLAPGYILGGIYPWPSYIFETPVELTKNVKIPEESPFYGRENFSSSFNGEIKAGSKCIQTLRKGTIVNIKCVMSVKGNAVKY